MVLSLFHYPGKQPIGESRTRAVRRFVGLERSLHSKHQWEEFGNVMDEYFQLRHAELVPQCDLDKPPSDVFYLPMHAVRKECSTTTKLRVVFDASAKSSTGVSLNDTLLVGHTVHSSLTDVLLRFRLHRVAVITDVSKMYRAVNLADSDKDFHRFVWRDSPDKPLLDYRMTRVTFGVSASSFAANMSLKQNAIDLADQYPMAFKAVSEHFYVDDGLTGADSVEDATELRKQLQESFAKGGFLLRKWRSSSPEVLEGLPQNLRDVNPSCSLPDTDEYTKTLGIQWNSTSDHFKLTISELTPPDRVTKRFLISDIAKTYDILGWFSPTIIMVKILFQQLWEQKVGWDDVVPDPICEVWLRWRRELKLLSMKSIPRCYFPKQAIVDTIELHGFSDASETAYAAVAYFCITTTDGRRYVSLITSKTKVAPIKRLTIPRLELCGALILARLLSHLSKIFNVSFDKVHAWTDSTVVLHWLVGNPRRFKTFVGNRISEIVELTPPNIWKHVNGKNNPADCASRGLLPSELIEHDLWWRGPEWLHDDPVNWPEQGNITASRSVTEEEKVSLTVAFPIVESLVPFDRYSSYNKVKSIVAWMFRFIKACKARCNTDYTTSNTCQPYLTPEELRLAEIYIVSICQRHHFKEELNSLTKGLGIPNSSCLASLNPSLDVVGLLHVGGRQSLGHKPYDSIHPVILHGKHPLVKLIIRSEHFRLLHAGPTLLSASLSRRFYIVAGNREI